MQYCWNSWLCMLSYPSSSKWEVTQTCCWVCFCFHYTGEIGFPLIPRSQWVIWVTLTTVVLYDSSLHNYNLLKAILWWVKHVSKQLKFLSWFCFHSSDVVWETKPKKKSRWRPMSVKQTDKLEQEFKDYSELTPSENKIIELESNVLVILIVLYSTVYTYTQEKYQIYQNWYI